MDPSPPTSKYSHFGEGQGDMGTQNTLKIKAFTWLLFQEKILTKIARAKWSHQEDTLCSLCGSAEETVEHLFVTCRLACQVWRLLKEATGFTPKNLSIQGLWEAGRNMENKGDRSVAAKVSQSCLPGSALGHMANPQPSSVQECKDSSRDPTTLVARQSEVGVS
ncbi:hypothetical protein QJS10_CPA03g01391 [Acorus calamus]|uniref:Reverse transcriptase zinc-binding domain-containing protein n=1 Tax=Acorus calamus TaxID=4465 RepID=A0AAV9FBI7_ACOCL|nr:hypothetical protein QJS10_CPA03g01391 [Acorus calamus]